MIFIVFFEFSLGPLLWIYMAEIMTEKGMSIGAGLNWVATVIIALFTVPIIDSFGGKDLGSGRLFVSCGAITLLTALFCLFILKETKGLSNKQVAQLYTKVPDTSVERTSYEQVDT